MDNFGVLEVASERRTVAPGWAYVPDTPVGFGALPPPPGSSKRKRAARHQAPGASYLDLTSRQEAKLRKELEVLDRDGGAGGGGGRDAVIPIPAKAVKAQNKHTATVRKILASQKTFANHLDDFRALAALHDNSHGDGTRAASQAAPASAPATTTAATATASTTAPDTPASGRGKRGAKREGSRRDSRKRASLSTASTTPARDTPMTDAPAQPPPLAEATASTLLRPYDGPVPPPHPLDHDPLLVTYMPPLPTDAALRALLAAPPLPYAEARATWPAPGVAEGTAPERRYPGRVFCEICGYWGRVKCTKCGTPVCALDCLETHREDCITRYGL